MGEEKKKGEKKNEVEWKLIKSREYQTNLADFLQ